MNPIRSLVWFSRTRHITTVGNFLQLLIFFEGSSVWMLCKGISSIQENTRIRICYGKALVILSLFPYRGRSTRPARQGIETSPIVRILSVPME